MTENEYTKASLVVDACREAGLKLALAESCTGGLISAAITSVSGSSEVLDRGFVTYANEAKMEMLGVRENILVEHGAVSEEVARAMAEGALVADRTDISVSVTGIAGPGGGSDEKPVGLVHMASARRGATTLHQRHVFSGDRDSVRRKAVMAALELLLTRIQP